MKNKLLAMGMTGVLCLGFPIKAYGAEIEKGKNTIALSESAEPFAAGLITDYALSCSGSAKKVCITARTKASETMAEVGFTNIVVQRSSDKNNWTTEVTVRNNIKENTASCYLNNYAVSVKGGYYYRVKCTHYAKENGWFADTQSIENTSSYVWIA